MPPPFVIRHSSSAIPRRRRGGFALLITITLLAFLVLLLVSLASLTRVETQVASNSQQLAQARQNALLALNIALGQLQRYTGPDQRVTATADLRPVATGTTADPVSGQSLNTGSTSGILNAVDTHWRASRNRRWVGVWQDPNPTRTGLDPDAPASANPTPSLLGWLVSGNESSSTAFQPETQVANVTLAGVTGPAAATATFGTTANPYRLLVGAGTAGIAAANDIDRAVVAPQVDITSDTVPGLSGPRTVGHYAWWVGDEGVKAQANQIDAYATDPSAEAACTRLQSAQRPSIGAMTAMSGLYPTDDSSLTKVLTSNQLPVLNTAAAFNTGVKALYHDLTVRSRGVLADVRHGGLKADLSWMLGQSSATDFQNDLRSLYADNTVTANDPILGPVFTPYVAAPGTGGFTGNFALGLGRTATWAQLRSYFNMGNATSGAVPGVMGGGTAQARIQRVDTQGLGPMMVQAKAFFGLQVDAAGNVSLRVRPLVVLANPYDVTLTGNFWVRFNRPIVYLYMGAFGPANPLPSAPTMADLGKFSVNYTVGYQTRMFLTLQNVSIPPGEARVYCLDKDYTDTGSGATQTIRLVEGYDDAPVFTMNTGRSLGTNTHAALYVNNGQAEAWLYGADPATNSGLDDNLIQYVYGRPLNQTGVGTSFFLVYPTAAGETNNGGGCWFLIYDSLTTSPSTSQQANFLQFNLRTLAMFYTASSSYTHPTENTQSYQRNGSAGNDAWFTADLMFDNASGDKVRWGPVDKAASGSPPTTVPAGVGADTGFVNILYDLPSAGHPPASIAQLQHFSPCGFISNGRFGNTSAEQFATQANTFQVNYPSGNSYPNPRVPRDRDYFANTSNVGSVNVGTAYDGSWLYNEVLADRFFFSTYPASGPFDFTTGKLVNNRLRPFRPAAAAAWNNTAAFRGAARTAATDLMVDGVFNINSTSREAWKAVLSSLKGVPVGGHANTDTPHSRTLYPTGGSTGARTANTADAWDGFDTLSASEIGSLADEIVLQIRRRGPFLSLADFMNRRLTSAGSDPMNLGLSGALQSAIDAILNRQSDVDPAFRVQSQTSNFAETAYQARTMTAGAPGYLLQADLLSPLGPSLSARSDTFTIRTYGDTVNPSTGEVTGRAWCEAVVQRTPDYVVPKASGGNDPDEIPAAGSENATFGRRYTVVSFRWLGPEDL